MKLVLSLILTASLWAGTALAQTTEQTHDELRALNAGITKAMNDNNMDALLAYVHPNVVFTTMNDDVVRGPQAIREYYAKMMTGPDKIVEKVTVSFIPDDLTILYLSDTMGVCVGKTQDHYVLTDGTKMDLSARWTATFVKENGKWLVAAFHYSTSMFENPLLDRLKQMLPLLGIGGAVIGLLAGVLIGRKTVKR